MKRRNLTLVIGSGVAALALAIAPASAALATDVTNPADNPYPITVTVDGQTYHDGLDTLPGYDDYACTVIPGVSYDFGHNRIDYPDGQTAPWTEWSRIPGYAVWVKQQQNKAPSPNPSPSSSSSSSSSSSKKHSGSHKKSSATSLTSTVKTTAGKKLDASDSTKSKTSATPAPTGSGVPSASDGSAVTASASLHSSTLSSSVAGSVGTSFAGYLILAALAIAGALVLGVHRFGRVIFRRGTTPS